MRICLTVDRATDAVVWTEANDLVERRALVTQPREAFTHRLGADSLRLPSVEDVNRGNSSWTHRRIVG